MKILIVCNMYFPYISGGAELSSQILAEGLVERGHEIHILTNGFKNKIEFINGVKVFRYFLGKRSNQIISTSKKNEGILKINRVEKLKIRFKDYFSDELLLFYSDFLKDKNYDIVHTTNNMLYFNLSSIWRAAKNKNIKIMHTLRDSSLLSPLINLDKKTYFDKIHRLIWRRKIKDIDFIHSPSKFILELHKNYNFNFKNEIVIPNTLDLELIKLNFSKKINTIVYVGGIEEHKGILTLIKAFESLKTENFKLQLIGSGKLESYILKNYNHLNIEITGWISKEEVYKRISKAKILILPSEWNEAFGRVLVEGVYNGTLVIGSDRGGIPEVLDYKKDYIFKCKNVDMLKYKILNLLELNDKEYTKRLLDLRCFMKRYSRKEHLKKFDNLYLEMIK